MNNYEILKLVFGGLKAKYYAFDVNGDGTITDKEFRQVLEELVGEPCPDDDWNEFISRVDYDGSETIEFEEFLYALFIWFADDEVDDQRDEVDAAFQLLKTLFRKADSDCDGVITRAAFEQAASQVLPVTPDMLKKVYARTDQQGHGSVNFKTFLYNMYLLISGDE